MVNVATGFLNNFPVDVDDLVAPKKYGGTAQYGLGDVPNGSYLVNGKPAELPKQVKDEAVRAKVYALLEKLAVPRTA